MLTWPKNLLACKGNRPDSTSVAASQTCLDILSRIGTAINDLNGMFVYPSNGRPPEGICECLMRSVGSLVGLTNHVVFDPQSLGCHNKISRNQPVSVYCVPSLPCQLIMRDRYRYDNTRSDVGNVDDSFNNVSSSCDSDDDDRDNSSKYNLDSNDGDSEDEDDDGKVGF